MADRYQGQVMTSPLDNDRVVCVGTRQCGHCGRHWLWQRNSGRHLGWCTMCQRICCPGCDAVCVTQEAMMENIEAGRPWQHKTIRVQVGVPVPGTGLTLVETKKKAPPKLITA